MSYDPIEYLGLSCPSGGDFYICQDSETPFLGCCDVDPCADQSGACPSSQLHAASFDVSKYGEIPAQTCAASTQSLWYTCLSGPYIGCCTSNPCAGDGVCPEEDQTAAVLGDDSDVFLSSRSSTTSSTRSSSSTATTTLATSTSTSTDTSPTPTSTDELAQAPPPQGEGSSSTPVGAIVGGVIGGLAFLAIMALIFFCYRRKHRGTPDVRASEDEMVVASPPFSPYQDSFMSSPTTLVQPGSPRSMGSAKTKHASLAESLFSPLKAIVRPRDIGDKARHSRDPSYEQDGAYDWVQSPRAAHAHTPAFAELEGGDLPARELESPPPGQLPVRRTFHDETYHEMEGSLPPREVNG